MALIGRNYFKGYVAMIDYEINRLLILGKEMHL